MSIQKLASQIAKKEGKKSQAKIGDVREILKVIKAEASWDPVFLKLLVKYLFG